MRASIYAAIAMSLVACSDPPKSAPPPAAAPAPKAVTAAPKSPAAPAAPVKLSVLDEARKRTLSKDDFTEADTNRDPFRSFLQNFIKVIPKGLHPILLDKFSIEELKLAGIVTGELQPRAMFIDPSGQGVTVVRGNHISKADAVVTRIAADRVYVRTEEDVQGGEPRVTEREIKLHAGELSDQ